MQRRQRVCPANVEGVGGVARFLGGGGGDSCLRKRNSMLTRDEQTPSNEQTTTPWSISETNDHNEVRTNIISDRWLGITLRYDTFSLKVKASAITRISASVTLGKKRTKKNCDNNFLWEE